MNSEPFAHLRPRQSRRFLPEQIDLTHADNVTAQLKMLLDRSLDGPEAFERFLLDRSELEAAIAQQQSILYIQMTCRTDDAGAAGAYKAFIEQVVPAVKPYADQLDRKCLEANRRYPLDTERYGVYLRALETDVSLFREENINLQTEESLLSQRYQTVIGGMIVPFEGGEYPVPQMAKFLLEPDRLVRRKAWEATAGVFSQQQDTLDDIFDAMIRLRHTIALNAGFANYRDYKFQEYHRFDYTPADCRAYHESIEAHLVPLQRQMHRCRAEQLGLESLRPWDLETDPQALPPLKPAETMAAFVEGTQRMFTRVRKEFGEQFEFMRTQGLLDMESRKGKAPGGYQSTLSESRVPFIFMNAIGVNGDLKTLTHEGGHAFHALACADDPLLAYRHAPMEFCEVASMSMELLTAAHLDIFYDTAQQKRWRRDTFERTVRLLIQVALFDAFQHWLYENPMHTRRQRNQKWLELNRRFGSQTVDWTGLEAVQESVWQRVLHFYQVPFYYIEYGIAQLGALGVWQRSRQDYDGAVALYQKALALGGSRPLPELFQTAGLAFDFSEKTVRPIAELLKSEWQACL
jgi:oligoendopeptidase F